MVLDGFVVGMETGMPSHQRQADGSGQEVYRGTISRLAVSPDQENQFIAYLALPEGGDLRSGSGAADQRW